MKKKIIITMMTVALAFSLVACGGKKESTTEAVTDAGEVGTELETETETETETESST